MGIIEIEENTNGYHENRWYDGGEIPAGWALIPDGMSYPDTFPFVTLTVDGQTVTAMTAGTVPVPEPIPEPTPTPTAEDDINAMAVDHEYRLTLLEMGVK